MEITEIKAHALIKERLQKNKKIIRVAAYCRVSTDNEDQMNSLFLRLYNKYKKIYGVEELNNNLYKYAEFGNINQLTMLLCKNGFSKKTVITQA